MGDLVKFPKQRMLRQNKNSASRSTQARQQPDDQSLGPLFSTAGERLEPENELTAGDALKIIDDIHRHLPHRRR